MSSRSFLTVISSTLAAGLVTTVAGLYATGINAATPSTLSLDYAYYAPTSLVVREQKALRSVQKERG